MGRILESRLGKYCVIGYGLFAMSVYAYVFFCTGSACVAYIILPIMPWAMIIVQKLGLVFPSGMYPIFILVNASVSYVIGATLEWIYYRYVDDKEGKKLKPLQQQKKNNFFHNA